MRKFFWLGGSALLLFIVTAVVANAFQPPQRRVSLQSAGYDFLAFYAAGHFVRTGEAGRMYDVDAVRAFQQELARRDGMELKPDAVGPFWNPPFYAWPFALLSATSYGTAFAVWTAINIACLAGALAMLASIVAWAPRPCVCGGQPLRDSPLRGSCMGGAPMPLVGWRHWLLVPLLAITSMPLIMAIGHGQNTCVSLLILSGVVALWRGGRAFAEGVAAGLLFYKPQLGMIVAGVLALCYGWRAIAGLAVTGATLLLVTVTTLPGTLGAWFERMPGNLRYMQVERPYLWDRHVTLKAFWRLLVQGLAVGETSMLTNVLWLTSAATLALCVVAAVVKLRRRDSEISRDRVVALAVLAMPLLMPFYFDYDLLLLAVPATLAAREMIARGVIDRPLTAAWVALYGWLIVNPHVAALTRVNGTVVLLGVVTATTIAAAIRSDAVVNSEPETDHEAQPLRRAA